MTELFARPARCLRDHGQRAPRGIFAETDSRINAVLLRDQITSRAMTVLLVLLAASGLVFIIACWNGANLILARTVRREGELSIRAALPTAIEKQAMATKPGFFEKVRSRSGHPASMYREVWSSSSSWNTNDNLAKQVPG